MNATLKVSEITVNEQPRKDFSRVDDIAESIKTSGLLQPIAVRKKGDGSYILVDGEQRLRAVKKLKWTDVPVYLVKAESDHVASEKQMMANLMRSDLTLIERMRGYQHLLENCPAKYNERVIANRFGLKLPNLQKALKIIRKLSTQVDEHLASGRFNPEDLEQLSEIPQEFQLKVVVEAHKSGSILGAILNLTKGLFFDDVFNESKARSAGKLHFKWGAEWRTFDTDYADKVVKEFEARTKKNYQKERVGAKVKAGQERQKSLEKQERETKKKKEQMTRDLEALRLAIEDVMGHPRDEDEIRELASKAISRLWVEHLKLILRAFGVYFKTSSNTSDELRKLVMENVFHKVDTPEKLTCLFAIVNMEPVPNDPKEWAKAMAKNL